MTRIKIDGSEVDGGGKSSPPTQPAGVVITDQSAPKAPLKYLSISRSQKNGYRSAFARLTDPDFADAGTRSYIEMSIERQIAVLDTKTYRYRSDNKKRKAEKRREMAQDLAMSRKRLYGRFVTDLSKYSVVVRKLSKMPSFATGTSAGAGIYSRQ